MLRLGVGTVFMFEQAKKPNKSTIWNQYTLWHIM